MKKNRIWILVGLMSAALIGIILVQVFWIGNAIAQKQKIFAYQVNDALNKVADKVETNMAATLLGSHFNNLFGDSLYLNPDDSATLLGSIVSDSTVSHVRRSDKNGNIYYEENQVITYGPWTSGMNGNLPLQQKPALDLGTFDFNGGIFGSDDDLVSQVLKNIDKEIELNSERIRKAMRGMMIEMMNKGINPETKIDTVFLRNTLQRELRNKGISTDFNYGVMLGNNYFLSNVADVHSGRQLLGSEHRVNLFPDDPFSGTDLLLVDFPHQKDYILSSIWYLLLGSLLFTAIIVVVFYFTVHILFRQKKLSEIKNDFINNMTHEFKTPLATISLAVDAINNPMILQDGGRVKHYTQIIKQENRRMNSHVEKVLQMALLDKNQINISKDRIDMHDIIQRAVDNISLLVHEKGGSITTSLDAHNAEILADEVHMMSVIYNLLDNANKYSPSAPEIRVKTESNKKGLFVTIEDKGIGMSAEHIHMIFEKFYRVPTGNLHNIKGFGLGLTYVRAIIDAHEGSIEVKSQLKKGSQFKIFLPYE